VDRSALHIRRAHPVDRELQSVEVLEQVSIEITLVEEQLVTETGTPTRLHGNTQVHVIAALLFEEGPRRRSGGRGQGYAVGGCSGFGWLRGGHRSPSVLLCTSGSGRVQPTGSPACSRRYRHDGTSECQPTRLRRAGGRILAT